MSNKTVCLVILLMLAGSPQFAQISINGDGSAPDPSAGLEIKYTNKGFLPPRLSTVQRFGIITPATGLTIFNTDLKGLEFYKGAAEGWYCPCLGTTTVWNLSGNNGTVSSSNFIGTTNSALFKIVVNGQRAGRIELGEGASNNYGGSYFGYYAGDIQGAGYNTAIGHTALSNSDTSDNTAFGARTAYSNVTGSQSTGVGYRCMYYNISFGQNSALGCWALYYNLNAQNIAIGNESMFTNTSGALNVVVGGSAFRNNLQGSYCVAVGASALGTGGSTGSNIAVGSYALMANAATPNVAVGADALKFNAIGTDNTATGAFSMIHNNKNSNSAIGYNALMTNVSGNRNTALGSRAMELNDASDNTSAGYLSMLHNMSGVMNVAIGYGALSNNEVGSSNSASGAYSLYTNISGSNNTAIGEKALYFNNSGSYNTADGYMALYSNTTGGSNTAHGYQALSFNTTGSFNTAVGNDAGPSTGNLNNTTAFGYQAWVTESNHVVFGNSAVSWIGGQVNWTSISDERFKTDVRENVPGLSFISKLKPVTYTWDIRKLNGYKGIPDSLNNNEVMRKAISRQEEIVYTGFLAQEVETAAGECSFAFSGVTRPANAHTPYSLSYASFTVPLVKATRELNDENMRQMKAIDALAAERSALMIRLEQMKAKLAKLEKGLNNN